MPVTFEDRRLLPIREKVEAGERLSYEDGVALYRSGDMLALGHMANLVRERMHGDTTYFNVNRHINPTNVCLAHCKLCAFGRDPNAPGAYVYALEEIYQRAEQGAREGATEFHIVGGLHPDLPFQYFLEMIRGLKQRCPGVHLKAFTMVEVGYFARIAKLSIEETLRQMQEKIAAKRVTMSEEEARQYAERAVTFKRERNRLPSLASNDPWEKKLAEGVAAYTEYRKRARSGLE